MSTGSPFLGGKAGRIVKLTIHFYLVSRLRICRSLPSLPQYVLMVWCFKIDPSDIYKRHKEARRGKSKVVPVLNSAPINEDILGEWRYSSTHSLISALEEGEWSVSYLCRFTSRERVPVRFWKMSSC
jgi:hypothetical protein